MANAAQPGIQADGLRPPLNLGVGLKAMSSDSHIVVAEFTNDTALEMRLYLEMLGEEIVLAPNHRVELLAKPEPDLQPLTISYVSGGIQVHAFKVVDPDWHIRFKGKLIRAGHPTILSTDE